MIKIKLLGVIEIIIVLLFVIIAILSYIPVFYIQKRISRSETRRILKTIGNYMVAFLLQTLMVLLYAYLIGRTNSQAAQGAGWLVISYLLIFAPIFSIVNLIVIFFVNKKYTKL